MLGLGGRDAVAPWKALALASKPHCWVTVNTDSSQHGTGLKLLSHSLSVTLAQDCDPSASEGAEDFLVHLGLREQRVVEARPRKQGEGIHKIHCGPGVEWHVCNPCTQEVEASESL